MKRIQQIAIASVLALVVSSTAFAGNISVGLNGNISVGRDGNISVGRDGNISVGLADQVVVIVATILGR
jgi:hypothetical protein